MCSELERSESSSCPRCYWCSRHLKGSWCGIKGLTDLTQRNYRTEVESVSLGCRNTLVEDGNEIPTVGPELSVEKHRGDTVVCRFMNKI